MLIALRATGFTPYAIAAASAGLRNPTRRRVNRYAPIAPIGIARTTSNVRANPTAPKSTVPRPPINASTGGAGVAEPRPV